MNRVYSLVWSDALGGWTAVGETARRRGKPGGGKRMIAAAAVSLLGLAATGAHALPTGGQIVGGKGDIATSLDGKTMSVNQQTDKLITNWQDFSIAAGERVSFHQPTDRSIALNRVLGTNGSQIHGQLDANGRLFVVNPNGVVFGKGAQVNVGGLVASTRDLSDADFLAGKYRFSGTSQHGVLNEGTITAAQGGSVALLGAKVSNLGTIEAKLGRVALGAGNTLTVNFDGSGLLNLQVENGAVVAQVHNGGLLKADGGEVLMTARAAGDLLGAVVNNTGTIEARGLNSRSGKITLDGGLVKVGGKLDASAQDADASGGVVTTRGERVEVAGDVQVDTRAPGGRTGTWKIEAANASVGGGIALRTRGGGDYAIETPTLARTLGTTNVELTNTKGDLSVGGRLAWASDNKLTLTSQKGNVILEQAINASGENAGLTANAAKGIRLHDEVALTGRNAHLELNSGSGHALETGRAVVTLSGANASFRANGEDYTVIHDLAGLRNVDANLDGRYVLGNAIKGSGRFRSIGGDEGFTGVFDGLGNTISGLSIYGSAWFTGLFAANFGWIGNLNLQSVSVRGNSYGTTGVLAGLNDGTISNVSAKDIYASGGGVLGGLVGSNLNTGIIDHATLTGKVEGDSSAVRIGGLVGANIGGPKNQAGVISNSHADAQVSVKGSGSASRLEGIGGLVGVNLGKISGSSSAGSVTTSLRNATLGGLAGRNQGLIDQSSSTASVTADGDNAKAGGLVGINDGTVSTSKAAGDVTVRSGGARAGGLAGANNGRVSGSDASGRVLVTMGQNGRDMLGGLIGQNLGVVESSTARGAVNGNYQSDVGGLVGWNSGRIADSRASGSVTSDYLSSSVGGLVGFNDERAVIDASAATGDVAGGVGSEVGGLVGRNAGSVNGSTSSGTVSGGEYAKLGGLVGMNFGKLSGSTTTSRIAFDPQGSQRYGGLVGFNVGGSMVDNVAEDEAAAVKPVGRDLVSRR